jgi:pimeloyl-ACP methyl ester carboxylesterase
MIQRALFSFALILSSLSLSALNYVGEIQMGDDWHYLKLTKDSTWQAQLPYLFPDKKFDISGNPKTGDWHFDFPFGSARFHTTSSAENEINASYKLRGPQYQVLLHAQGILSTAEQQAYIGHYIDEEGFRAQVYTRFDYLHIHSPYALRVMSLKSIGENLFFCVSGEYYRFSEAEGGRHRLLTRIDRDGQETQLQRMPDYRIEQRWMKVRGDSIYGELYIPHGEGPHPGILVFRGAELPMDENRLEAQVFVGHGMAVFIFDKPGVGRTRSTTRKDFLSHSFRDKADYYADILTQFTSFPEVDPLRAGLHGGSEQGRLAVMLAALKPEQVKFIIAVSAPMDDYLQTRIFATQQVMLRRGYPASEVSMIAETWRDYLIDLSDGAISEELVARVKDLYQKHPHLFLPDSTSQLPTRPRPDDIYNNAFEHLEKVGCPVLFQYGENDDVVNVMQCMRNIQSLERDEQLTIKQYRRANHSLMLPEMDICTGILEDKVWWLGEIGILE